MVRKKKKNATPEKNAVATVNVLRVWTGQMVRFTYPLNRLGGKCYLFGLSLQQPLHFHWQSELLWCCSARDSSRLGLSCCSLWGPKDTREGKWQEMDAVFPALSHQGPQKALREAPRWWESCLQSSPPICKRYSPCPKSLLCNQVQDTTPSPWFTWIYSFHDNGDNWTSKLSALTEDLYLK